MTEPSDDLRGFRAQLMICDVPGGVLPRGALARLLDGRDGLGECVLGDTVLGASVVMRVGTDDAVHCLSGTTLYLDGPHGVVPLSGTTVLTTGLPNAAEGLLTLAQTADSDIARQFERKANLGDGENALFLEVIQLRHCVPITIADLDANLELEIFDYAQALRRVSSDVTGEETGGLDEAMAAIDASRICTLAVPPAATAHELVGLGARLREDLPRFRRILSATAPNFSALPEPPKGVRRRLRGR